jgi:hypothetical protein
LRNGDPVFTSSTKRDELLGARLISSGAVNESLVELALRQQPPLRLGEALVTLGALQPAQLVRELASQLEDRLLELGSWSAGEACFIAGAEIGEHTVQAPTATLQLITRLVKNHYDPAEIAGILRPLAGLPLSRAPKYRSLCTLIGLTRAEYAALEESSSASSIQVLAAGLGKQGISTWADTLRAVFVGLSAGLLRTAGWPEACLRKPSLSDS